MSPEPGRYSSLPQWPKEAGELPEAPAPERCRWAFLLGAIALGLGVIQAGLELLRAEFRLNAEGWGFVTGQVVFPAAFGFAVGYLFDYIGWVKERKRRAKRERR